MPAVHLAQPRPPTIGAMTLEIHLTGLLTVKGHDGVRRYLSSVQTRLAFARLTLDRHHGTTRDELADTLWSDRLPSTWAPALRSVISRVRAYAAASVGPATDDRNGNPLVWQSGRYVLHLPEDAYIDVEQAVQAILNAEVALRRGELDAALRLANQGAQCLERGFLPECESDWVETIRKDFDDLTVSGLEIASMAAAQRGDSAEALMLASRAIARAPLRERAHRCRIAAHRAAGNRAEALRAYEVVRRLMADELGVRPSPETEAVYLGLLQDDQRIA